MVKTREWRNRGSSLMISAIDSPHFHTTKVFLCMQTRVRWWRRRNKHMLYYYSVWGNAWKNGKHTLITLWVKYVVPSWCSLGGQVIYLPIGERGQIILHKHHLRSNELRSVKLQRMKVLDTRGDMCSMEEGCDSNWAALGMSPLSVWVAIKVWWLSWEGVGSVAEHW